MFIIQPWKLIIMRPVGYYEKLKRFVTLAARNRKSFAIKIQGTKGKVWLKYEFVTQRYQLWNMFTIPVPFRPTSTFSFSKLTLAFQSSDQLFRARISFLKLSKGSQTIDRVLKTQIRFSKLESASKKFKLRLAFQKVEYQETRISFSKLEISFSKSQISSSNSFPSARKREHLVEPTISYDDSRH